MKQNNIDHSYEQPNKKQKISDQLIKPNHFNNEEDKQPQLMESPSTLSQHIGEHTIYIQESPYGFRHSKYAADYRRTWKDIHAESSEKTLGFQRNIATMKLVPNPNYYSDKVLEKILDTNYTINFIQGAKSQKDPKDKAVYVTLPSLTKHNIKPDPHSFKTEQAYQQELKKYKHEKVPASYHSEPQVGKALIFGHNKGVILDAKDKTGKDKFELEHNKITENGKYLIKWVYSEREPCLPGAYKNSCQEYLEGLAKVQFQKWMLPIEVYYTNAYLLNEDTKKYKANKIDPKQVIDSKDHPLSSKDNIHQERQKDLQKDVSLGKIVLYSPTIDKTDLDIQQQKNISQVNAVESALNKAKLNWEKKFKEHCASGTNSAKLDIEQLAKFNVDPQKITYADREKIYKIDGYFQALMIDNDQEINKIEDSLTSLIGPSPDLKILRQTQTMMNAIKEEKAHENFKDLKELEVEVKLKIAQAMKDGGNKDFIAEGQKLLSHINNTICEYRQCRRSGQEVSVEGNLKEYKISSDKLFDKLELKEDIKDKIKNEDINCFNSNQI